MKILKHIFIGGLIATGFLLSPLSAKAALTDSLQEYWKFDESSGNAIASFASHDLTNNGSAAYVTGKINNGVNAAGSAYMTNTSTDFATTGDQSLSFWVKFAALPTSGNYVGLVTKKLGTNPWNTGWALYLNNAAGVYTLDTETPPTTKETTWTPSTGVWYHIVWTYNATGHESKLYIDGSLLATVDQVQTSRTTTTDPFLVGAYNAGASIANAVFDELGVWTKILTSDEVSQLFNSNRANVYLFTETPSLYGGVSYWKLDESSGNAADSVGSNTAVNTNVTYSTGKINNGAVFNGSSAKFTITDANNLDITGALTMGVWVNINNMTTGGEAILAKGDFNTGTSFTYGIDIGAGGDGLVRGLVSNGSTYNSTGYSSSIKDTNWHHIVVVYIPSTSLTLYIDGSQVAQNTTSIISSIQSTAWNLFIGADGIGRNLPNTSKIDEPAIWNRNLTSTEVTTLYNGGAGNQWPFTVLSTTVSILGLVWSYIF